MVATSQGAPFLLNFDERAMAGLMHQARRAGVERFIHAGNVHDYASVGCLENTMVGNDRSGTVDLNLNLLKAVELALSGGRPVTIVAEWDGDGLYPLSVARGESLVQLEWRTW